MTGDYRRDLHAGFTTPESAVFDFVIRATGLRPVTREQLARGYDNEVYRVATRQGPRCIVRIKRRGGVAFQHEAWALAQCRALDVPAPELLALDWIAIDGQRHEAMVQRELPGVSFSDLRATLSDAEQARVLEQAGAALRRIHRVPVGGFYRPNSAGGWDITTWERIAALAYRDRVAEREEILRAGFNDDDFARMQETLRHA
jgi:aminoglycoside phosphotransferase (APT) family kinase protein